MHTNQFRAVAFGLSVHLARFAIIWGTLAVAPMLGITGWYLGLAANVTCVVFAATIVTVRGLWKTSGILAAWRGSMALILLIPLVIEALLWVIPAGLIEQPPGVGLWIVTLLLAAGNEELTSRVIVLERMRTAFRPHVAVGITAALFGLQHLSAFATTSRAFDDILFNVLVSACYGFALAAFQFRFHWVWPLILLHAGANFATILSARPLTDTEIALTLVMFIALGLTILRLAPARVLRQPLDAASYAQPSSCSRLSSRPK